MFSIKKAAGGLLSAALMLTGTSVQAATLERIKPAPIAATMNTGHSVSVRFVALILSSEYNLGYTFGSSESTTFVCQYNVSHEDNAYNNHTISNSDIRAAANRLAANEGYTAAGWTKSASKNPSINSFSSYGTTACNKGDAIYIVFNKPAATYTHTLSYNANGGSGAPSSQSVTNTNQRHSFTVSSTIPTRDGYDFLGWSTSSTAATASYNGGDSISVGANDTTTLYAVWKAKPAAPETQTFTLTYDANGGTGAPGPQTGESSTGDYTFTIPYVDPVRDGYNFLGWDTDKSAVTNGYEPGDGITLKQTSVTLYAVWQKKAEHTFVLQFDPNGGEHEPHEEIIKTTDATHIFTIPNVIPDREGYVFKGWSLTPVDSSSTNFIVNKILGNARILANSEAGSSLLRPGDTVELTLSNPTLVLHAVWEKVETVTLTYVNDDQTVDVVPVNKGEQIEIAEGPEAPEGKLFNGWSVDPAAEEGDWNPGDLMTLGASAVLYAIWKDDPNYEPADSGKKNSTPAMEKSIVDANGAVVDPAAVKAGQEVTFQLSSNVPDNLFKYVTFESANPLDPAQTKIVGTYDLVLHDLMDGEFVFTPSKESIEVKIIRTDENGEAAASSLDYTLDKCSEADQNCSFHIVLDLIELYNSNQINEQDVKNASEIQVTYKAKLSDDAAADRHINKAWTSSREPESKESDVELDVFELQILKLDADHQDVALKDAVFKLYDKPATEADRKEIAVLTTGDDGKAVVSQLAAGTYYLLETTAPDSYVRSTKEIKIELNKSLEDFTVIQKVLNSHAPSTGGAGTMAFTIGGIVLLGGALLILIIKKKKEREAE